MSTATAPDVRPVVVIVDDDVFGLALLRNLVEGATPARAETFTEPKAALAFCMRQVPDVVITDFDMPQMSGLELIRVLRADPALRDVPIMMITALEDRDIRYAALESGANDYLNKPLDAPEVRARVRNMMAVREGQKVLARRSESLAHEVRAATRSLIEREREIVLRLSRAAEFRDLETGSHIMRIAHFSQHIARALGLGTEEQEQIFLASPMHDVGKIGIPDQVLLKPGRFTDDEMAIMRQHTVIGHKILAGSVSPLLQLAAEIALTHHEKWNGTGYPYGRSGEEIPVAGRIVAVADVFDALLSRRPYKKAWTMEEVLALLQSERGQHFDPACIDAFFTVLPEILETRDRFGEEESSEAERSEVRKATHVA